MKDEQQGAISAEADVRAIGYGIEPGNVPGNPLRSYRMSMLSHGFVGQTDNTEFTLDESDPMSYGVVRVRGGHIRGLLLSGAILLFVAVVVIIPG